MKIGLIILPDSGAPTEFADRLGSEIERAIGSIFLEKQAFVSILLPVGAGPGSLHDALLRLIDGEKCPLVITAGGTGLGLSDIAPDATRAVLERELPGFGEIMRSYSYERSPASLLSRATAGTRSQSLIVNLPGRPRAIRFCLKLVREAIAEAVELIGGVRPALRGDEIVVPLEKYLPFLKFLRVKPDPRDVKDPRQKL